MITLLNPLRFSSPLSPGIPLTVVNPGAETGDTTGWTASYPSSFASITNTGSGFPGPKFGTRYFTFGEGAPAGSTAHQDIAIPADQYTAVDTGLMAFWLLVWRNSYDGETSRHTIIAFDGSDVELERFFPQRYTSPNVVWVQRMDFLRLPAGTRKVRIVMEAITKSSSYLDAFFDAVQCWLAPYTGAITAYGNPGGRGNRAGVVTVTSSGITFGAGTPANLVNGTFVNDFWWNNGTNNGTQWVKFDFGSAKVINELRWYQDIFAGSGTWAFEGSNDDSAWTTINAGFNLDVGMMEMKNTVAYRYYRLRAVSGNRSQAAWLREIEFKISA